MAYVLLFFAGVIGAVLAASGEVLFGFIVGGLVVWLLLQQHSLRQELRSLRTEMLMRRTEPAREQTRPTPAPARETHEPVTDAATDTGTATAFARNAPPAAETTSDVPAHSPPEPPQPAPPPAEPTPGAAERLFAAGKHWLTTGNVPVKLGVLVSFFGVAFLLKYAVDRQIVVVSIEMRYLLVAIVSSAVFFLGWRLREKTRTYALSLQGGGIGALYLTIFAAFRLHPILPATVAFLLLIILTAATGWLAVRQDARPLALLGTVGGFMAPILVSTGSGNHVALFGYYLVLNAAVLYIAWSKTWRMLNLLGFLFTFGVGTMWGYEYYQPAHFATVEPFLIAFFLFYHAIAILFATRQEPRLRGLVDGTLVFGTPAVVFGLQSQLLEGSQMKLAASALVLSLVYAGSAYWVRRFDPERMKTLFESYLSIAVALFTLAIPLALDDRWTAVAWALEGAGLVWLGFRQQRLLSKISGPLVLVGSAMAYVNSGWTDGTALPILNANVLPALICSALILWSAHRFQRDDKSMSWERPVSVALMLLGTLFALGAGTAEILDHARVIHQPHVALSLFTISFATMAFASKKLEWPDLGVHSLVLLPLLAPFAFWYIVDFEHPLTAIGLPVWLLALAAHLAVLYLVRHKSIDLLWHYIGALFFAALLIYDVSWRIDAAGYSGTWSFSGAVFLMLSIALAIWLLEKRARWPLLAYRVAYNGAAFTLALLGVALLAVVGLGSSGDPAPLPYIPIANPFDALAIYGIAVTLYAIRSRPLDPAPAELADTLRIACAVLAFLLSTAAVVRGVHFLADVPWDARALAQSVLVQASLSIYWAILGLAGMVLGARRNLRMIWMIGAGLMIIVVIKLFLIDLGNTGTVARIVSFLGVGGMLMAVGYYAPAPPRAQSD